MIKRLLNSQPQDYNHYTFVQDFILTSKIRQTETALTLENSNAELQNSEISKNKHGIIPAIILHQFDLSTYASLQNLISFTIDCLNQIPLHTKVPLEIVRQFNKCIDGIVAIKKSGSIETNEEIGKLLSEFIDESEKVQSLLNATTTPSLVQNFSNLSLSALITAKTSRVQWIAVCLTEELKRVLRST